MKQSRTHGNCISNCNGNCIEYNTYCTVHNLYTIAIYHYLFKTNVSMKNFFVVNNVSIPKPYIVVFFPFSSNKDDFIY